MPCCNCEHQPVAQSSRFKLALYIALALNLTMFAIEITGGAHTGSAALWADALDFLGDSINYIISLLALGLSLYWRATVALFKGLTLSVFAIIVFAKVVWAYMHGIAPEPITMGIIALLALIANLVSAVVLYAFREGDANMRSVWLCSRNDAIGNMAVMFAALGVFGTKNALPDLIVATLMAALGLSAGIQIIFQAQRERRIAQKSAYSDQVAS